MSPETMHGKILFDQAADPNENRFNNAKFNRSTWFAEDLLSQNPLDFCKRYLGMPSYEEMFDYIIRFFHEIKNPTGSLRIVNPLLDKFIMYHTVVPGEQKKRLMYHIIDDIEKIDKRRLIIPVRRMPKDVSKTNDE